MHVVGVFSMKAPNPPFFIWWEEMKTLLSGAVASVNSQDE